MKAQFIPIILVLILAGAAAPAYSTTNITQLSWRDTGYDLTPGYRHTITLTAHYTRLPGYLSGGEPKVQMGPLTASLKVVREFLGFHYEFKIVIDGETVYTENHGVHLGNGEVSVVFQVDVECDGNAVVYVDGENVGSFMLTSNADILKDVDDQSSVHVTSSRLSNCNTQPQPPGGGTVTYTYTPPPNPDHIGLSSIGGSIGSAAGTALAIILIGFGVVVILIVLAKAGGARRLARRAIG